MTVLVEAAVESLDDALAAMEGGAGRLELCAQLAVGGTTPSAARVESLLAAVDVPLFVMIRPRGGSFVYSDAELTRMCEDVVMARALGAAGVVLGVLDETNRVDLDRTAALVEAAGELPVTFHRAIDQVADRLDAIAALAAIGVARVLSSGGAETAMEGADALHAMTERASGRLSIVAGGGVRGHNARALVERSGVREVHARCGGDPARIRGIVRAVNYHSQ
jgi:copper homeostasis protein